MSCGSGEARRVGRRVCSILIAISRRKNQHLIPTLARDIPPTFSELQCSLIGAGGFWSVATFRGGATGRA